MNYVFDSNVHIPLNTGCCSLDDLPNVFAHIKLVHFNARDVRVGNKFIEIESIASTVGADVICVSETFLSEVDAKAYNLHNFSHQYIVRERCGGGGVSIFVSKSFDILEVKRFHSADERIQIIRCKISRRALCCYVVAFYSNNRSMHEQLLEFLDTAITELALPVIVLGDSNINTLSSDMISTQYLSFFSSNGLLPAIDGVTRYESSTCLDHIFLPFGHVADSYSRIIETSSISDHFPIWTAVCLKTIEAANPTPRPQKIQRRIFSSTNFSRFISSLSVLDFSAIFQTQCVDKALLRLESLLFSAYSSSFPIKSFCFAKPSRDPFFPDCLKRLRRRLDRLRRKYYRDRSNLLAKFNFYAALKGYRLRRKEILGELMNNSITDKIPSKAWKFL